MLTRATSLLIVIGCSQTLSTNPTWCNFINYVKANGGFQASSEVSMWSKEQIVRIPFKSYQQVLMENPRPFDMSDINRQPKIVVQPPIDGNVNGQLMGPKHEYPQSPTLVLERSVYSSNMQQTNRFPQEKDPNEALTQRSFTTQRQVRKETEPEAESNQPENDYVRNSENSLPFSALDHVRAALSSPLREVPEIEIEEPHLPGVQKVPVIEDHGAIGTTYSGVKGVKYISLYNNFYQMTNGATGENIVASVFEPCDNCGSVHCRCEKD